MKIQKSTEIETELNNATKRLDELTEMRDGITANLETLQQGFIDGKTSLDELQTEQGKLTTLESSIKALESKQDELRDAFQKASFAEAQAEIINRLKSLAASAEEAFATREQIRMEFDSIIGKYAKNLFDASVKLGAQAQDFTRNLSSLSEDNQKQLRSDAAIGPASFSLLEKGNRKSPNQFEFADVINTVETFLARQKYRAEQREQSAIFSKQRMEKQAEILAKQAEDGQIRERQLERERKRIIQARIDNNMPPLSPPDLEIAAADSLAKSADSAENMTYRQQAERFSR
jgi:hypothetical protein